MVESSKSKQKYIFLGGGVASGIGKGITISSIGYLLQQAGYNLSIIKIDPYLNVDAGLMAPREHGECFILNDGGEVDLDLGNYERALNLQLSKDHSITSGKIFQQVLTKEREGGFLGKTVQLIPHVTEHITEQIQKIGKINIQENMSKEDEKKEPDIVLIELGGTVGDLESAVFYESVRQQILKSGRDNILFIFISYVPYFNSGEFKTKPCQNSLKQLQLTGIQPDFIVLRSDSKLSDKEIDKISLFGNLNKDYVIGLPNYKNTSFEVPLILDEQNMSLRILQKLNMPIRKSKIDKLETFVNFYTETLLKQDPLKIGLVGKYIEFNNYEDVYLSVMRALESAAIGARQRIQIIRIDPHQLEDWFKEENPTKYEENWAKVKECDGYLLPGGFDVRGFKGSIKVAQYARENDIPTLGICFGFQTMIIEFCRNVLEIKDASSQEFVGKPGWDSENLVINDMPDASSKISGASLRLGAKETKIMKESMAYKLYGKEKVFERYRHRFEVNLEYRDRIEEKGMKFTGFDGTGKRMEILELPSNKFYFGTQYHPELKSRNFLPAPTFLAFIYAVSGQLQNALEGSSEPNGILKFAYPNKL